MAITETANQSALSFAQERINALEDALIDALEREDELHDAWALEALTQNWQSEFSPA